MITVVRSAQVIPGKLVEVAPLAKEICGIVKRVTDIDVAFCTAFGGNIADVAWISQASNIGQVEENWVKLFADAGYRQALAKLQPLLIPGTGRDQFWRHA